MNLSTKTVRELLNYNPDTGVFTWRERSHEWFKTDRDWRRWNNRYAGKIAGTVHRNARGYPSLLIRVLNKTHYASRLAFLWKGKPMPEQVDHDDGDSLNQAWENLLASTATKNQKNRSMSRTNTSGFTGVHWHKPNSKWLAKGSLNGKQHHLGLFNDINEAAAVVATFYAANGYTARHGKKLAKYQKEAV